jgi:cell division protein FtsB
MKKLIATLPAWIKNKYLLAGALFLSWMFFFSDKDILSVLEKRKKLNELINSEIRLSENINSAKLEQRQLQTDVETIEQYARERYLMKKENEDLFVVKKSVK